MTEKCHTLSTPESELLEIQCSDSAVLDGHLNGLARAVVRNGQRVLPDDELVSTCIISS